MKSSDSSTTSLGQVGYEAYGDHPGKHGAWLTFDGRPMPKWLEYVGSDSGTLTQERWEVAAAAIIVEYERRRGRPGRKFHTIRVLVPYAADSAHALGLFVRGDGTEGAVILETRPLHPIRWTSEALDLLERWEEWAPEGRAIFALEVSGTTDLSVRLGALEKERPDVKVVGITGCGLAECHLRCPRNCGRTGCRTSPGAKATRNVAEFTVTMDTSQAQQQLDALTAKAERAGEALTATSTLADDGRLDPFLLGLQEIASATRDLAEATRAIGGSADTGPVAELIEDVAKALHARVKLLSQPAPSASA